MSIIIYWLWKSSGIGGIIYIHRNHHEEIIDIYDVLKLILRSDDQTEQN